MSDQKFVCPKCGGTTFTAREMVKIFVNEVVDTSNHSRTEEFEVTTVYPLADDELSGPADKDWTCLSCNQLLSRPEGRALQADYPPGATKVKWV
jgi:hypothetical protein